MPNWITSEYAYAHSLWKANSKDYSERNARMGLVWRCGFNAEKGMPSLQLTTFKMEDIDD